MSYIIHKADGTAITIPDNVLDTSFYAGSVPPGVGVGNILVGRNTVDYGAAIAQNIVQMTENFAKSTPPTDSIALQGQLWFNKTSSSTGELYVRTIDASTGGLANWSKILTESTGGDLSVSGDLNVGGSITAGTPIAATSGGTGFGSYTIGDILYASSSTTLSKLPVGSVGQVLTVSGGLPAWSNAAASGVLSFNTRTGAVTLTSGDVTTALGYTPVNKAGDTMTGSLILNADPVTALGAATKQYVDNAITANPTVPVGTVIFVPATTAPTGFLKLNGALISRTTYANLWTFAQASGNVAASEGVWLSGQFSPGDGSTTFRIPDARGYFIRSWADNSPSYDVGRAIGSIQYDAFQGHWHNSYTQGYGAAAGGGYAGIQSGSQTVALPQIVKEPVTDGVNGAPRTSTETRPINIPFLACIKY